MQPNLQIPRDILVAFCQQNRIRKLALFGSVLRDDFGPDSDVDMLVEFEEGARVGLITFSRMAIELSEIIGRKVDLRTPASLSRYFRQQVIATAQPLYERS